MGDDSKGPTKDRSNGTVLMRNVQGSGASGVTLWKQELDDDRGDYQGPDGTPPSGSMPDHRDAG